MFDLGDAHYRLTRRNIQLVARTRIHLSLPSTPIQSPSVQDLLTLGLWITRGNGLGLRIRADFNAFAHSSTGVPHDLHHVLGETLPLAKLWTQLPLRPSLVVSDPTRSRPFEAFDLAFTLTQTDLPQPKRPGPAISPDPHHVRPPTGVLRGSIDSIELTLIFAPLVSLDLPAQPSSPQAKSCHTPREGSTPMTVQSSRKASLITSTYSFSDRSPVEPEKADGDILFQSPESELLFANGSVFHHGEEALGGSDMLPLPEMHNQRTLRVCALRPLVPPRLQAEEPLIMSQSALDPPAFMSLVDHSLRHALGGMIAPSRNSRRPSVDTLDIQLVQAESVLSLADIAPALFRPGFLKAISQRAHLVPRIAASISCISSRSCARHHCSTESVTPPSSSSLNLVKPGQLQTQLWHLLQKRKWPTEPLEPLDDCAMSRCNRDEGDQELILDTGVYDGPSWESPRRDPDDEIMLDLNMDFIGTMDEDEDLFSSYERTPVSSQETESLEMMLEPDQDEEIMLEEDLLLLSDRFDDKLGAIASPGGYDFKSPGTSKGVAWSEDLELELLDDGCEDGDDKVSTMLF